MGRKKIIIILIAFSIGIASIIIMPYSTKGEQEENEIFSFEIIGYNGSAGLVGVPTPPIPQNYTGTIVEADTYSYDELIFRITYNGLDKCRITKILLWQEIPYNGEEINYTGVKDVTPPSYSLEKDQFYEFLVDSGPWPQNFLINPPISIRIYTESQGEVFLTTKITYGISKLPDWSPHNPYSTTAGMSLILLVSLTPIIGIRRRRGKGG